jgi:hypothetical protein
MKQVRKLSTMEAKAISKNGASLKGHTSKRNMLKMVSIFTVSVLLFSCTKEDDDKDDFNNLPIGFIEPSNNSDLLRNTAKSSNDDGFVEPTNKSDPFIFTDANENSLIALYRNQQTGIIQQALFVKDNKSLVMIYGTNGLPIGMYTEGYYFFFSNYKSRSVDISAYNSNKEFIAKETVENDDIFNLIQEANALSIIYNYQLRSGSSGDELRDVIDRQIIKLAPLGLSALTCAVGILSGIGTIPTAIVCGSAIVAHGIYFLENHYPNYDKNSYLGKVVEHAAFVNCLVGGVVNLMNVVPCALSVIDKLIEMEEEYINNLNSWGDDGNIDIPRKDANDYIKVTTRVTDITNNSAVIIGEISLIGDGHRKYNIRFQGVKWGHTSFTDGTQIDPTSISFSIPIKDLSPDAPYNAQAFIITDYYYDWWDRYIAADETVEGTIEPFRTLPEEGNSEWVEYNGLRIATRNVGASSPGDLGSFFQWNRNTPGALEYDDYYNRGYANATSWTNSPCPAGYRIPTVSELRIIASAATLKKITLPTSWMMWGIYPAWEYWSSQSYDDRNAWGLIESNMVDPLIRFRGKHTTALLRCVCND